MKIIIGLGNPGDNYKNTRHNIGFEVIDNFAKENNININKAKFNGHLGEGIVLNKKVLLLKPQTYMNLSGESLQKVLRYYSKNEKDIVVVYDDISLNLGKIRIREKGSSGGQNGVKNIINCIGTDEFIRIRVGIGAKPDNMDLSDYVLSKFKKEEEAVVKGVIIKSVESIECILEEGCKSAMNKFN